jgi:ABC-type transport system involved in cytochrome c biogenesis permease component
VPLDAQLVIGLIVLLHVGPIIWAVFSKSVTKTWLVIFVVLPFVGPLLYVAKRVFDSKRR